MFFKEKPLYDAKQNTLILGVQLINERSKALRDVFVLINEELASIAQQLKETEDTELLWRRQVELESFKQLIPIVVKYIQTSREMITSRDNAECSRGLNIYNPFLFGTQGDLLHLEKLEYPYFSTPDFQNINNTQSAFTAAKNHEMDMFRFRRSVSCMLFLIAGAAGLTAGFFITLCVNPIIGQSIIALMCLGLPLYIEFQFDAALKSVVNSCTTVTGPIDVGMSSNPELFSELDELQAMCEDERPPRP